MPCGFFSPSCFCRSCFAVALLRVVVPLSLQCAKSACAPRRFQLSSDGWSSNSGTPVALSASARCVQRAVRGFVRSASLPLLNSPQNVHLVACVCGGHTTCQNPVVSGWLKKSGQSTIKAKSRWVVLDGTSLMYFVDRAVRAAVSSTRLAPGSGPHPAAAAAAADGARHLVRLPLCCFMLVRRCGVLCVPPRAPCAGDVLERGPVPVRLLLLPHQTRPVPRVRGRRTEIGTAIRLNSACYAVPESAALHQAHVPVVCRLTRGARHVRRLFVCLFFFLLAPGDACV
jgi:hypothetical protein